MASCRWPISQYFPDPPTTDIFSLFPSEQSIRNLINSRESINSFDDAMDLLMLVKDEIDIKIPAEQREWMLTFASSLLLEKLSSIIDQVESLFYECLKTVEAGVEHAPRMDLAQRFTCLCCHIKLFQSLIAPILQNISEAVVTGVISRCRIDEDGAVSKACGWAENHFFKFLVRILPKSSGCRAIASKLSEGAQTAMKQALIEIRCDNLFDIIVAYPATEPAVRELCEAIHSSCTSLPSDFMDKLMASVRTRLLTEQMPTIDILKAFVSSLKILSKIDASGCMRDKICDIIKEYLRKRSDTIRAIIESMGCNDGVLAYMDEPTNASKQDDDDNGESWQDWMPEPLESFHLPLYCAKTSDILSMLIGVYDSPAEFVHHFKSVMCDRIFKRLFILKKTAEQEKRQLQVLVAKFGKIDTSTCQVMLNDLSRSMQFCNRDLRIKLHVIRTVFSLDSFKHFFLSLFHFSMDGLRFLINMFSPILYRENLSSSIASIAIDAQLFVFSFKYWPEMEPLAKLCLPEFLSNAHSEICERYELGHPNQKLDFFYQYELTEIKLELSHGLTIVVKTTLLEAIVIMKFCEKSVWICSLLAESMNVTTDCVKHAIRFWIEAGLISEGAPGHYLLEEEDFNNIDAINQDRQSFDHYEPDKGIQLDEDDAAHMRRERYLKLCWHYVTSILKNIDGVTIERLFSIIRNHSLQFTKDIHLNDIKTLVDSKITTGELVCTNTIYRLGVQIQKDD